MSSIDYEFMASVQRLLSSRSTRYTGSSSVENNTWKLIDETLWDHGFSECSDQVLILQISTFQTGQEQLTRKVCADPEPIVIDKVPL